MQNLLLWFACAVFWLIAFVGVLAVRQGIRMGRESLRKGVFSSDDENVVGAGMVYIGIGATCGTLALIAAINA